MAGADAGLCAAAACDALTGTGHAAVEVHAVNTNRGVVLDTEIDVLANAEAEVASLREVALAELILLDLEATLKNLLGLHEDELAMIRQSPIGSDVQFVPWGRGR